MSGEGPESRPGRSRLPDLDTVYTVNPDGSRNFLHPADVAGPWQGRKNAVFAFLILVSAVLPWIVIRGHPAILIDIPGRQAFLFGRSFTNQDFYLLFFLVSGAGFALFVLTSLWGRLWCGFACPQTVWMEGVFRRIERLLEGSRERRIRRNQGPWNGDKAWRKGVKHLLFLGGAFLLSHFFIAYFIPIRDLVRIVGRDPAGHATAFAWVVVMTGVLYFDFAWFREQTCTVVCPYGRLQSALIDRDTILIGYDVRRGEPRGKAEARGGAPGVRGSAPAPAGDCVDCRRCIVVCPTGIDIRNGLQLECIGCANCVDACDEMMLKLGRPRGLVRFDSQNGFEGARRRFLRPRVFVYAALGLIGLAVFTAAASRRTDFEVRALRARGMPYQLEGESIRNLFNLEIQNKGAEARTYFVRPEGAHPPELELLISEPRVVLGGNGDQTVPVFARFPRVTYRGAFPLAFTVRDSVTGKDRRVAVRFLGPE